MILENIPREPINFVLMVVLGIILALVFKILARKIVKVFIYPPIRKNSPGSYKNTVNSVNLIIMIIQWAIIFLFIFQAVAFLDISMAQGIISQLMDFIPRMIVGLLVLVAGLIFANIISRKIKELEFKNNLLVSKATKYLIIFATVLSALEILGLHLTSFLTIFQVTLYFIGITAAIGIGIGLGFALKPEISKIIKDMKK